LVYFFASRRRHTRSKRDWSSDVCSSDLNYLLDQLINDRGIKLDLELVAQAIKCDDLIRNQLVSRMKEITKLENPNSVKQMREWLQTKGVETDSLNKAAVIHLIETNEGEIKEVLQLRKQLAKSSVKKYAAMENVVCRDGRARGLIQFYGANRTGRFAGRLIQVQNLPQNHISDLDEARALLKQGNFEALQILYDSVPSVLSQLIRTAFVPIQNNRFIIVDFSAIEARV